MAATGKNLISTMGMATTKRLWGPRTRNTAFWNLQHNYSSHHITRSYTNTHTRSDLSRYYKVEVSNKDRPDATKITVVGPDVDGILASMTVALAREGCSLKELHAGYVDLVETRSHEIKHTEGDRIEDVFFVAKHDTGEQFPDDDLQLLGESLLTSLANPLTTLSGKDQSMHKLKEVSELAKEDQITVVKKND